VFLDLFWAMFSVHEMSVRAQKMPRIGDNESESAEMVTEITDKHEHDRNVRVHSRSAEISGSLHFSGTSNALPYRRVAAISQRLPTTGRSVCPLSTRASHWDMSSPT
jgi:hypothetical protein